MIPVPTFRELAAKATKGPWMHLLGDDIVWSRLNDGCRGMPIARTQRVTPEFAMNATFIARCDPATLLVVYEALEDLVSQDDHQEPFNGLDMSKARAALRLLDGVTDGAWEDK